MAYCLLKQQSVPTSQLRIFRGRMALCDYRQLLEAEYESLFASLQAADLDGDGKVMPAEFIGQAKIGERTQPSSVKGPLSCSCLLESIPSE